MAMLGGADHFGLVGGSAGGLRLSVGSEGDILVYSPVIQVDHFWAFDRRNGLGCPDRILFDHVLMKITHSLAMTKPLCFSSSFSHNGPLADHTSSRPRILPTPSG